MATGRERACFLNRKIFRFSSNHARDVRAALSRTGSSNGSGRVETSVPVPRRVLARGTLTSKPNMYCGR